MQHDALREPNPREWESSQLALHAEVTSWTLLDSSRILKRFPSRGITR